MARRLGQLRRGRQRLLFKRLALDATAQISAFVKLKLGNCARPESRAGLFAWFRDELKFLGSAEEKYNFSSLAPFAWLRVPSALIRKVRIVVYNTASPGAMRFCLVVGLAASLGTLWIKIEHSWEEKFLGLREAK